MSDKTMFIIKSPAPEERGRYILMVSRGGGGPFGGGAATTFVVDTLERVAGDYVAYRTEPKELVVQFSKDTPYLLVERTRIEHMTRVDAEKRSYEEEQEVAAFFKSIGRDTAPDPTETAMKEAMMAAAAGGGSGGTYL